MPVACFEAKQIAEKLEAQHGSECSEVVLLKDRIKVCQALQKLNEQPRLHAAQDFKQMIIDVRDYWQDMPSLLKAKITWSFIHTMIDDLIQVEQNDHENITRIANAIADGHLIHVTSSSWDGQDPDLGAVLHEAFSSLEVAYEASIRANKGGQPDEKAERDLQDASQTCNQLLKARLGLG